MTIFQPVTVASIAHTNALLRDCRGMMNEFRSRTNIVQPEAHSAFDRHFKCKVAYVANSLTPLVGYLKEEGGTMAPMPVESWTGAGPAPIEDSPFTQPQPAK